MSDRPIIFSALMVRALLDGRKTQTRRVLKPQPSLAWGSASMDGRRWWTHDSLTGGVIEEWRLPYYIGDRLWVREAFVAGFDIDDEYGRPVGEKKFWYRATNSGLTWHDPDSESTLDNPPWKPSIHMPRLASRITLTVTDVRVQRLCDITEADAVAEGIERLKSGRGFYDPTVTKAAVRFGEWTITAKQGFCRLWNSIHGPDAWDANPWVIALTFTVARGNIDA